MEPKEILALAALKKAAEAGREAQKEVGVIHMWSTDDGYDFSEEDFSKALACDEILLYENGGSDSDTDYIYQFVDITSDYHVTELHFSNGERDFYLSIDTDEESESKFRKSCRRSDSSISNQISNLRTTVDGKQDILDETSKITVKQITATEKVVTKKLETSGEAKIGGTMTTADVKIGYKKSLYKIISEDGKEKIKYLTEDDLNNIDTNELTVNGTFRAYGAAQLNGINNGGGDITNVQSITAEGTVRTGDLRVTGNVKINDVIQLKQNNDTAELTYKDKTVDLMFVDDLAKNETDKIIGTIETYSDTWVSKSWNGISLIYANYIWELDGHIYHSAGLSGQHEFNKETNTWVRKSWKGAPDGLFGLQIWKVDGHVYFSSTQGQYELNKETSTWVSKSWNGTNSINGAHIWQLDGHVYYSNALTQYELNKETNTWVSKTWNGTNSIDRKYIWQLDGHVYYSAGDNEEQYELNKETNTWVPITWDGIDDLYGNYIWQLDGHVYYSNALTQYELNKETNTWVSKTWNGIDAFNGSYIWQLDEHVYYSAGDNEEQYELPIVEQPIYIKKQIYLTPEDKEDFIEHTYAELKDLKDQNKLVPGKWYRITDFVTTCNNSIDALGPGLEGNDSKAKSAGHPFDIIVMATSTNEFAHNAGARLHKGDTYFADCRLEQWVLKYDFDNNINKYKWAVTDGSGKGVIYEMVDQYKNHIGYDFKNIMFYRNKDLYDFGQVTTESGVAVHTMKDMMCAADGYYYTFAHFENETAPQLDATVAKTSTSNTYCVALNVIENDKSGDAWVLTNNVILFAKHLFASTDNPWCNNNYFRLSYGNTINMNDFTGNTFVDFEKNVIVGRNCMFNDIRHSSSNKFYIPQCVENVCLYTNNNVFKNQFADNNFVYVTNNVFEGNTNFNNLKLVDNITANALFTYNNMKYIQNCVFNGEVSYNNLIRFIKNTCNGTLQGVSSIGQCNDNIFPTLRYSTISPICSALDFGSANNTLVYATIRNIRGASATNRLNLSGLMILINRTSLSGTQKHYTIEGSENGKVLCYWLDDNGNKKGYYLDTTNNTWKDIPAATTPHLYTYYVTYDGNDDYRFKAVIVDSKDFNTNTQEGIIALLQQPSKNFTDIPVTGYSVDPADMELISIRGISQYDTDRLYFSYYTTDGHAGPYQDYFEYDINQFTVDKVQLF